jgi:phosphate-selective porin OprO/OprP
MIRSTVMRALLGSSALLAASGAFAQDAQPDPSDATADAAIARATPVSDSDAKLELLEQQVEALQGQIEALKSAMIKTTPTWKGAPNFEDKESGFSFKPKGTLQVDAGYVGFPDGHNLNGTINGLNYDNLGFDTRFRRAIIGAEGTLPGGFGYNVELNFAQGKVDYEDIVLTYQRKGSPLKVTIGNFYPYSSLETVTSSKFTSMLERASITDAFNYNRRLGLGVQLLDPKTDRYTLSAGLFSEPVNNDNFQRTGWEAALRGTFSPTFGSARLHLGASYHHRVNTRDAQNEQLRTRPLTQLTDVRFIDTGKIAAKADDIAGVEFGAIFKSLHVAAEAQKIWLDGYRPGETFGPNDGTAGGFLTSKNPSFWGGYAEIGYFLTGETRGYKQGRWDRTKVLHPFNEGGWGAFQLNGRVDYVDLQDDLDGSSASLSAPLYVNGGKQLGLQASLIWLPTDYLRFMAQYGHVRVDDGPRVNAATGSSFSSDTAAVRAQIDF